MITIQRTVDIPADRHLMFDLTVPETIPAGKAQVLVVLADNSAPQDTGPLDRLLAHKFPTIEEIKAEAAQKAAKREAAIKATGKDPIMELRDSFKHAPFAGVDGVAYQREMRDEWPE
jgi:hypothetical protein